MYKRWEQGHKFPAVPDKLISSPSSKFSNTIPADVVFARFVHVLGRVQGTIEALLSLEQPQNLLFGWELSPFETT